MAREVDIAATELADLVKAVEDRDDEVHPFIVPSGGAVSELTPRLRTQNKELTKRLEESRERADKLNRQRIEHEGKIEEQQRLLEQLEANKLGHIEASKEVNVGPLGSYP